MVCGAEQEQGGLACLLRFGFDFEFWKAERRQGVGVPRWMEERQLRGSGERARVEGGAGLQRKGQKWVSPEAHTEPPGEPRGPGQGEHGQFQGMGVRW